MHAGSQSQFLYWRKTVCIHFPLINAAYRPWSSPSSPASLKCPSEEAGKSEQSSPFSQILCDTHFSTHAPSLSLLLVCPHSPYPLFWTWKRKSEKKRREAPSWQQHLMAPNPFANLSIFVWRCKKDPEHLRFIFHDLVQGITGVCK